MTRRCRCNDCKRSPPLPLGEAMPRTAWDVLPGTTYTPEPRCYRIIRFRYDSKPRTVRNNVTLTEAQAHCRREDTNGFRDGVRWFDGYDYMQGCRPDNEGR